MPPSSPSPHLRKPRYQLGPFQFGIGHILAAMLVAVVIFTCVGGIYREGVARKRAESLLDELGGKLAVAPSLRPWRSDPQRRSLSFVKPIDDEAMARLAPYAQWLTGVYELDLRNTRVTGDSLASIRQMPHLETLILDGLAIDDESLAELSIHPHLRRLSLAGTRVGDAAMRHMPALAGLESLSLSDTSVADRGLADLAGCATLESLDLAGTPVTHEGLVSLRGLRKLTSLDLSRTEIGDEGMSSIKRLDALEDLNLSRTKVTAQIIPALEHLRRLEELDIQETGLTSAELERMRRALPNVEVRDKAAAVTPPAGSFAIPVTPAPTPTVPTD